MSNFKSQAKRRRELAKLDKRQAKDQKRAVRKAQRAGTDIVAPALIAAGGQATSGSQRFDRDTATTQKPMTLAEAVERWRKTKVVKPKRR
jgi:hypothetical protein